MGVWLLLLGLARLRGERDVQRSAPRPRIAHVVVSTWKQPRCMQRRFSTLPPPRLVLTNSSAVDVATLPTARPAIIDGAEYPGMRGKTSRDAKKQFVHWLAHSDYEGAWHLEDDVNLAAANWTRFFRTHARLVGDPDLAAELKYMPQNFYFQRCELCKRMGSTTVVEWPLLFLSRRFARYIWSAMRTTAGHHEVLTWPLCQRFGCRAQNMSFPGIIMRSKWDQKGLRSFVASPEYMTAAVRHPEKCKSKHDAGVAGL